LLIISGLQAFVHHNEKDSSGRIFSGMTEISYEHFYKMKNFLEVNYNQILT